MDKQAKIRKVMREFKNGTLKSSDGKKVTSRKQAIAIAMSEAEDYAEKADLISAINISSVHEAEEILKAAGTEGDLFEKARKVGDEKVYQGVTYYVAALNSKGVPLWRKKKDGGGSGSMTAPAAKKTSTSSTTKKDKTFKVNEETLKKQLKEFNGKLLGLQTKDGVIIGISVQFEPRDYYAADDFVKKHKEWRATTNTGNNYEFVYLNKEGKEELRKRGFRGRGIDDDEPTKSTPKSKNQKEEAVESLTKDFNYHSSDLKISNYITGTRRKSGLWVVVDTASMNTRERKEFDRIRGKLDGNKYRFEPNGVYEYWIQKNK